MSLPIYDDRYIKYKIITYGDESKYYLQIYLDNCACKIVNRYIDDRLSRWQTFSNWWRLIFDK